MKDQELDFLHLASTVKALSMSISGPWKAAHHHVKAVSCSSVCLGCAIFQGLKRWCRPSPYPVSVVLEWSRPSLLKGVMMLR